MFGCQLIYRINFLKEILMEHYLYLNASLHSEAAPLKHDFWWNSYFPRPHQLVANTTLNTYVDQNPFSILCNNYWSVFFISLVPSVMCKKSIIRVSGCSCDILLFHLSFISMHLLSSTPALLHGFPWHLSIATLCSSLYPLIGSISSLCQFIPYRQVI